MTVTSTKLRSRGHHQPLVTRLERRVLAGITKLGNTFRQNLFHRKQINERENNFRIVLLIGLVDDIHVQAVSRQLEELEVATFFFDPSEDDGIPTLQHRDCEEAVLVWSDGRELTVGCIKSVFCRYALDGLSVNTDLQDLEKYGCIERLQAALSIFRSLKSSIWINDPWHEARSDCKLHQVYLAKEIGLSTPKQIISSSNLEIVEFIRRYGTAVIKPISDASIGFINGEYYCNRTVPSIDFKSPYTAEVSIESLGRVSPDRTPSLIQVKIDRCHDIRAIVVDKKVFAYALLQECQKELDFRLNKIDGVKRIELPKRISKKLIKLVEQMELRFASCDLIQDINGNFIFLEANVSGNWLFCDAHDNLNVTREIALALALDYRHNNKDWIGPAIT